MAGVEGKIAKALEQKEAANEHFRNKRYAKARVFYSRAFAWINGLHAPGDFMAQYVSDRSELLGGDQEARIAELAATLHCNLAACYLALDEPAKALDSARQVLQENPDNLKALFRAGKAQMALGDFEGARAKLEDAAAIDPDNAQVQRALRSLATAERKELRKQQRQYAKMFASGSEEGGEGEGEGEAATVVEDGE